MTYYDILQVSQDASSEVIQVAYKVLAKKYHPDLYEGDKDYATQKMQQINKAYSILSSPTLRSEYDQNLNIKTQEHSSQYNSDENYYQPNTNANYYAQTTSISNKQKLIYGFKKIITGLLKFLLLCLANIRVTVGVVILILILLANIGVFDNDDEFSTTSSYPSQDETLPIVAEPISGTILSGIEYDNGSEITVTSSSSSSCVVKLKTSTGITRISFYVRAGETVTVGVPAEHLYVYFASGSDWYGTNYLFGNDTSYSMDDKLCDFTEYTWEYTLRPVTNGNFSQTIINEEDFK